jgi:MFS family permease
VTIDLDTRAAPRAGAPLCACPDDEAGELHLLQEARAPVLRLALIFACAVLAQSAVLGMLPLVAAALAPRPSLVGLPLAALMAGAVLAALPGALLTDRMGRRAALVMGATLGIAGAAALAFGAQRGLFGLVVLGALWLGGAQGFALVMRHAALAGDGRLQAGVAGLVLGAGALAALVAPAVLGFAQTHLPVLVAPAAIALVAQLAAFALAWTAPARLVIDMPAPIVLAAQTAQPVLRPLLGGAAQAMAWGLMTFAMGAAPLLLAQCGVDTAGISGFVAWHVAAMYAPALVMPALMRIVPPAPVLAVALATLVASGLVMPVLATPATISAALVVMGAGWSIVLTTAGAWSWPTGPSRIGLALQDAAGLTAALLGALASGQMF